MFAAGGTQLNAPLFQQHRERLRVVAASVQVLAIVKDRVPGVASETVCGGQSRQRHVMLSESHDVDVRMVLQSRRDDPGRYILIRYEGLATSHLSPLQRLVFFNLKASLH